MRRLCDREQPHHGNEVHTIYKQQHWHNIYLGFQSDRPCASYAWLLCIVGDRDLLNGFIEHNLVVPQRIQRAQNL